jgi:hypothetical protein
VQGQHLSVALAFFNGGEWMSSASAATRASFSVVVELSRLRAVPRLRWRLREVWGSVESADDDGGVVWLPFLMKIGAITLAICRTLSPTGIVLFL